MAIATERRETISFSTIGKIAKGEPKKGNAPGKNLDYFRFTPKSVTPEKEARLLDEWHKAYGNKPDSLNIFFKQSDIDLILNDWFREFGASGLKIQCDGEVIHKWRDDSGFFHVNNPRQCKNPGNPKGCGTCTRNILLKFTVFELEMTTGTGDVELSTKSINDITFLHDQLHQIASDLALVGRGLAYTPLVLSRAPRTITKTTKERQYRGDESLLFLSVHPDFQARLTEQIREKTFRAIGATYQAISGTQQLAPVAPQLALPEPEAIDVQSLDTDETVAIPIERLQTWVAFWTAFLGACDRCVSAQKLTVLTDWAKSQKAYINNPDSQYMVDEKLAKLAKELAEDQI